MLFYCILQTFANRKTDCKLLRTKKLGGFGKKSYLCAMIYELLIGILVYAVLFIVTVQSSRRKVLALQERLDKSCSRLKADRILSITRPR